MNISSVNGSNSNVYSTNKKEDVKKQPVNENKKAKKEDSVDLKQDVVRENQSAKVSAEIRGSSLMGGIDLTA